jgi:two-component system phosphate regulon sensor histidine kinase PhoR
MWFTVIVVVLILAFMAVIGSYKPEAASAIGASPFIVLIIIVVLIGMGIQSLVSRSLERSLLHPLQRIQDVTQAIVEGAVSGRIELDTAAHTDVVRVAEAVNRLAKKAASDITEMRRLSRVRSEFVGNVSHELRTPIFSVQGYLETLLDGAVDDPNVSKQFLEKAYQNALRLNTLLSDLIDISRIESGELRLSFRYFDVTSLLKDVMTTVEFRAEQRNVTLHLETQPSGSISVYGDKERLTQVFTNLIDNAIKYNVDGGRVHIRVVKDGAMVSITIADTGIGIPKDHLSRVFERFYRVDKDRSREVGGTGLGLAIVKHILEAHQTSIMVESEVGKGTEFSFALRSS